MYMYYSLFFFLIFKNSLSLYFSLYFLIPYLIYFYYTKGVFTIFDWNMLIEDRFLILLENIIKLEYNYILLLCFFTLILFLCLKYSKNAFLGIFIIMPYFGNYYNTQDYMYMYINLFQLNVKLLNGLFLIHPYCIYVFYSTILFIFYKNYTYNKLFYLEGFRDYKNYQLKLLTKLYNIASILGTIAIILGAWWAYQEINWNSWWSWDLIEIINLNLILILLLFLHNFKYVNLIKIQVSLKNIVLLLIFLLFLILSRYNIINSLHSFVVLSNFEQYSYFFFLFIAFLTFTKYTEVLVLCNKPKLKLVQVNIIVNFLILILGVYLYKIYYEILIFYLGYESYLEFLYFFKNINFIIFYFFIVTYLKLQYILTFITLFINFFFLFYLELILILLILRVLFKNNGKYWIYHFFIFFFIISMYININVSSFSFKLWEFNFVWYLDNIKMNFVYVKKLLMYFNANMYNNVTFTVTYYYIDSFLESFLTYGKKLVFFLSNFYFYKSYLLIFQYNYYFYYSIFFFEFFSLYLFLTYLFKITFYIKKKLDNQNKYII